MEGLTAFVSGFDKEKPKSQPTQVEATSNKSHTDDMPSTSSAPCSLPFSIAEILSDKRSLHDPQPCIESGDVGSKLNGYAFQGKMGFISKGNALKESEFSFRRLNVVL